MSAFWAILGNFMEKIILFDGIDLDSWVLAKDGSPAPWDVHDGIVTIVPDTGNIRTKEVFGDFMLHVEFMCPLNDGSLLRSGGSKQAANSGVYLQGEYELQIISAGFIPSEDKQYQACGGIYTFHAPLTNASRPDGEWQEYDIIFRSAVLDADGNVTVPAYATVIQNGTVIQNNADIPDRTPGGILGRAVSEGPIMLQAHSDVVHFRNIWIERL